MSARLPRAVFMGTPEAAVPSLRALNDVASIDLVVTRPDRPRGRSRRLQAPAVKEAARELGLDVVQPPTGSNLAEVVATLPAPDVGLVAAFGIILRPAVLKWPRTGFLNVHFSLLPRWRGAAPVERAIMAGDSETGVTIMQLDEGLDTGPIVARVHTAIAPDDTGGALTTRLARMGATLVADTVPRWVEGSLAPRPQPDEGASYAGRLQPTDRHLSPGMGRLELLRTVRALAPDPGAQLEVEGAFHKILSVRVANRGPKPGEWADTDGTPVLGVADGAAHILTIQPPGRRPMSGSDWLRGRHGLPGSEN